jgi:hypothetical protein
MVRHILSNLLFTVAFPRDAVVRTSLPLITSEIQLCASDEMSERAGASSVGEADSFPAAVEWHF